MSSQLQSPLALTRLHANAWQLAQITSWGTKFWHFKEIQLPRYSSDQWILYIPTHFRLVPCSLPCLPISSSAENFYMPHSMVRNFYIPTVWYTDAVPEGVLPGSDGHKEGDTERIQPFLPPLPAPCCEDAPPAPVCCDPSDRHRLRTACPPHRGWESRERKVFPLKTPKLRQRCSVLGCTEALLSGCLHSLWFFLDKLVH